MVASLMSIYQLLSDLAMYFVFVQSKVTDKDKKSHTTNDERL